MSSLSTDQLSEAASVALAVEKYAGFLEDGWEDVGVRGAATLLRVLGKYYALMGKDIAKLGGQLGASRTLLEEWMLASDDFDMDAWAKRVRDMLEDSNPFNRAGDDVAPEPKPCGHLRSELLAEKTREGEPLFQMRKCLDCSKTFRVRTSVTRTSNP